MYRETNFGKRIDMIALKRVEGHASAIFRLLFTYWRFCYELFCPWLIVFWIPEMSRLQDVLNLDCPSTNFDDPAAFYQTPEFLRTNAIIRSNWFCLEKSCNPKHCCGHIRRVQHLLYWNEHWLHKRQHNSWTRYITGRRDGQQIGPSDFLKSLTPAWSALLAW